MTILWIKKSLAGFKFFNKAHMIAICYVPEIYNFSKGHAQLMQEQCFVVTTIL